MGKFVKTFLKQNTRTCQCGYFVEKGMINYNFFYFVAFIDRLMFGKPFVNKHYCACIVGCGSQTPPVMRKTGSKHFLTVFAALAR
jgi:hypothetical protein